MLPIKRINMLQFLKIIPSYPNHLQVNEKDRFIAEQFLNYSIERFQQEKLLALIDEALDKQDRDAFQALTEKLNHLKDF